MTFSEIPWPLLFPFLEECLVEELLIVALEAEGLSAVADQATIAEQLSSILVLKLPVSDVRSRLFGMASLAKVGRPTMTRTALNLLGLLAMDLQPIRRFMRRGHRFIRMALRAHIGSFGAIVTPRKTTRHLGPVATLWVRRVDEALVTERALELQCVHMRLMWNVQVAVGRDASRRRVARQADLLIRVRQNRRTL